MGCGDEKLSKYLTQTFTAHCNAMICQQVTLSGDAEWPKVADAVIEALLSTTLKANETGVHPWRSMDTRVFPPPSKIAPCRNTRSVRRGARSSVRKKSRPPAVRAGPNWRCCSNFSDAGIRS